MQKRRASFCFLLILSLMLLVPVGPAAAQGPGIDRLLNSLSARPLGPANMGGRIAAVAVVEKHPATMYVATASGGLWKTVNNGTTWAPVFDHEATISIGDVAVAPSNPDVVWVGTGEANARNSVSWGDGVYKSVDGGKSWKNMGLKDSAHIGRIVIHPRDPDTVFVAAVGRFWGPNKERGLYKTSDGGKTWQQAKFLDENTGFIDLAMDPADPDTLYAAAYQCRRDAFSGGNPAVQTGPAAGIYKTTDGGKNWVKLTKGLPERPIGRCGLNIYRKDPRVVYAVVQTDRTASSVPGQPPRAGNKAETGGVFRSEDKGETWTKLNDLCPRPFYFGQIRVDPNNDRRVYVCGIPLFVSNDGGKTFAGNGAPKVHADHHALWIDPQDSEHLVLGCDAGLYLSYDRGATWEFMDNLPIGQFYEIGLDTRKPYRVYGGLQDNGSWGGLSATHDPDGITVADWVRVLGADGFYCRVDPTNPDVVYAETQYGGLHRIDVATGQNSDIRPVAAKGAPAYRFNWNAPFFLSPHDPHTVYFGGNHLFRSRDRGAHWDTISPDLTHGKPGPSLNTGHTLTALAESPVQQGVIYAGTDDGRLHVTRDGGGTWTDVSAKVPGVPAERWIARVECSNAQAGTAYVAIDRHRNDDRAPYLFKTADFGATWQPLANNLPPDGPLHVIREDPRNPDLLFAGTEFGLFASLNGGEHWHRLNAGLPTVAVHDLAIHPRDRDLVVATHGRGIYVLDILALEEITPQILEAKAALFNIKPATVFRYRGSHGLRGAKVYAAPNPPYGLTIHYYLKNALPNPAQITVQDATGKKVADLKGSRDPGLHQVRWNLRLGGGGDDEGRQAPPGDYTAKLQIDNRTVDKPVRIEAEK